MTLLGIQRWNKSAGNGKVENYFAGHLEVANNFVGHSGVENHFVRFPEVREQICRAFRNGELLCWASTRWRTTSVWFSGVENKSAGHSKVGCWASRVG